MLDNERRSVIQRGEAVDLVAVTPGHQYRNSFRGHKSDQAQQGSVIVRTRDDAWRGRSGVGAGGGAVALMVELLSGSRTLPESAPLSSYRHGNEVRVWRYTEALGALRQVVAHAGDSPSRWPPHIACQCSRDAGGRGGRVTWGDSDRR